MKTLKELLDERAAIDAKLKSLDDKRSAENRDFSDVESVEVDDLLSQRESLDAEIESRRKSDAESRRKKLAGITTSGSSGSLPRGPEPRSGDQSDPVTNPDGRRYSLLRAIERRAQGLPLDGYEGEVSQEIARRSGKAAQGFYLPFALPVERRDLGTSQAAGVIQTTVLGNRFIDLLRNRVVLANLGATVMEDMVGPFALPKQASSGAGYWVAEGNAPTESQQAIGQVSFTPATLGAFTDITRSLTKQTSMSAEQFVRDDLTRVLAIELDRTGINGSGSGAQPTGILQDSEIATVAIGTNGGAPTWAKIVEMESTVAAANADVASMAYLTSALGRGKLKTTEKGSAGYPVYLWDSGNLVNGYRAVATNQVPSNLSKGSGSNLTAAIFGDFSALVMAMWGGVDIVVDPYSQSTSGTVRVVALVDAQIKFRTKESLCKIVDMTR